MDDMKINHKDFTRCELALFISEHLTAFWQSIYKLSITPIASIITFIMIGVTLALPVSLFVLITNLQNLTITTPEKSAEISLYLKKGVKKIEINNLIRTLKNKNYNIKKITYISKKNGLKDFENYLGINNITKDFSYNPIPAVLILQPRDKIILKKNLNNLVNNLKLLPQVDSVQFDMQWLIRLQAIINLCHKLLYAVMFLFALAILLIIGNTIKLIMQKYKNEINIQKLLGATNDFIRRPFLYGGAIYGLVGSIISWLLVDLLVDFLQLSTEQLATLYGKSFYLHSLTITTTILLLIFGIFIGYIGAFFATYKEIKNTNIIL